MLLHDYQPSSDARLLKQLDHAIKHNYKEVAIKIFLICDTPSQSAEYLMVFL